ncbi:4'-phosphopantetheinyl transferase superfamily protein [Sulfitobacter albidus]|uniref:Enterobactin synthase component D n=1 Tax=Sulfitobacter albidus TaxID=2829501 RepID=A0A975JBI5_9RHOB|nr:4'-phosphopantetheinyl transferase superfamily protein [Sulfitobacter albidus]QUJ75220.1 4'-phosphopantetheinyl transferase superfamily protein [Sulfitobacter albidus]
MITDSDLVAALTASLLPQGVAVAAQIVAPPKGDPPEVEASAVQRAIPQRRAEFHSGRDAARRAMVHLGVTPQPVPMANDRAPVWPEGLVGSITHADGMCIAAVALSTTLAGIGIDLEPAAPLPRELIAEVTTPPERTWLQDQPEAERGLMARLIFSAKEAAYKAQYPLSQSLFGFDGMTLHIDRDTARFTARFTAPQGPFARGQTLAGRYVHAAGVLVTAVTIGHDAARGNRE